jgi:hypothetical protein
LSSDQRRCPSSSSTTNTLGCELDGDPDLAARLLLVWNRRRPPR